MRMRTVRRFPFSTASILALMLGLSLAASSAHAAAPSQIIKSFGFADGTFPSASLIKGSDGALYGTTEHDVTSLDFWEGGTLFKLSNDGSGYTILHYFRNNGDGRVPSAPLLE